MKAITVQTISFLMTKGGHTGAIINNQFSVVQNLNKEPEFTVYENRANGTTIAETPELIKTFTEAFLDHFKKKAEREEAQRREAEEKERERIQEIKDVVKGMTPQDIANYYDLSTAETAGHWNDLYSGKSSFAILINSHEENEIIQIAADVNDWEGEFGETKHRAGEHHRTFVRYYDLEDYQKKVEMYFDENFIYRSQDSDAEWFLEKIKEASDIDEVVELADNFKNLKEGYYLDGWDSPEFEGSDFSNCFGYGYDVYGHNFAYNFPSKKFFYDGPEEEETEEKED